jgi:hypothetical protein
MRRSWLLVALSCLLPFSPSLAAAQGPLDWEVQQDIAGSFDSSRAIALSGSVLVLTGTGGVPEDGHVDAELVVEALGRKTGAVAWHDEVPYGAFEPVYLTTRGPRAYVLNNYRPPDNTGGPLVRAYDVPSGTLLWSSLWTHPNTQATAVLATATRLYVVAYTTNSSNDGSAVLLRAYDTATGDVLWETLDDRPHRENIAWKLVANGTRFFLAGTGSDVSTLNNDAFVRAYDASTGTLLWDTAVPNVEFGTLALANGKLVLAGDTTTNRQSFLAAFSTKTGAILWTDCADRRPHQCHRYHRVSPVRHRPRHLHGHHPELRSWYRHAELGESPHA